MVLSISGLNSQLALNLIDSTQTRQLESLQSEPQHARAAEQFRERIASITTPKELVQDFEVYSFVMKAYDLEDHIFAKGMIRKILESDPSDSSSLVNKLTDSRFGELHAAMGFTTEAGTQTPDFSNSTWQDGIVDQYFQQAYETGYADQNEIVGSVLEFRQQAGEIENWYNVLSNETLTEFFQTALSLPTELSGLDVDKQAEIMAEKFDLADLADPAERERLINRYTAISEILNPQGYSATSSALTILQSTSSLSSSIIEITWDIAPVSFSSYSLYR
ncbi:DUF1217 domain-containing protein [Antarcticimicrobium sediminis]|uniref:DUF1217 domain-containing protein n=1 Tax=Antarcticimicrobium sediminis TaxID=2546227 RepID=A0A4R5EVB3_9RHOB|nr:DUF1217 domain-containing protein [Antarcticimicrobium sediminis]TDE38909.1 DUF1217 domain-containing protein [Antarcticimicrobium sediminis]